MNRFIDSSKDRQTLYPITKVTGYKSVFCVFLLYQDRSLKDKNQTPKKNTWKDEWMD